MPAKDDIVTAAPAIHTIPDIPRGTPHAFTLNDIESIADSRIRLYEQERSHREAVLEQEDRELYKKEKMKRVMTYAGIGVGGLAVGVGTTLAVQKFRANRRARGAT